MNINVKNLTLYCSSKQLKTAIQESNEAREKLHLSETALKTNNQKLRESVEYLNKQTTAPKAIAAEYEDLEKWIEKGECSAPFFTKKLAESKKLKNNHMR